MRPTSKIFWSCPSTWKRSSINTLWCLAGCSIGEFATLYVYQVNSVDPLGSIPLMALPLVNGIATSVALETAVLMNQHNDDDDDDEEENSPMAFGHALRTALRMSFVSMLAMETAMEVCDYVVTGGMQLSAPAIPAMLAAGFFVPLPYNYYKLRRWGKSCH